MSSPRDVKTDDALYLRDSHSPTEWPSTPTSHSSAPRIAIPQAYMPLFSEVPVSKVARDARKLEEASYNLEHREPFIHSFSSRLDGSFPQSPQSSDTPRSPSTPSDSRDLSRLSSEPPVTKIARPPNAFMIFRSWWLKKGEIPKHIEKRQQALSRVAGQVWGMLEEADKQKWHRKAAEIQRKHKEDNPDYKFVPSPRGSRRNKDRVQTMSGNATTAEDQTKILRETYTKYTGPSPIPTRKKQAKKARSVDSSSPVNSTHFSLPSSPLSRSAPVHPSSTPTAGSSQIQDPTLLCQPDFTQLHVPRRPSTSLGFNDYSQAQFSIAEASVNANKTIEGIHYNFGNTDQNMMFGNSELSGTQSSLSGGFDASWTQQPFVGSSPHLEAKMQGLHQQLAGPFPPPTVVSPQNTGDASQVKELFSFPALGSANFSLGTDCDDSFLNTIFPLDAYAGQPNDSPAVQLLDAQDSQNYLSGSSMGTDFTFQMNQCQYNFDDAFQLSSL
ncbi:hypothetical protein CVT25_003431 [Psilocybe cyanescens]|uniref:HMG box domain-containing protein n=1 Tax=Psilocybe cyanescens TaxID=93625 RepID=A0A409WM36_PSICY|nr:hypothetical protein CVT25_003431 [Psilocybe cyanescens]